MRVITALRCQFGKKLDLITSNIQSLRHFRSLRSGNNQSFRFIEPRADAGPQQGLLKPFAFTVLFSGASITGAAIWEYERIRAQAYRAADYFRYPKVQKKGLRRQLEVWWNSLSDGERLFVPICFANILVFLAWRVPALQSTMFHYFCHGPATNTTWAMVFSTFSHQSLFHLGANMIVLYSFCPTIVKTLGKEQFVAFYLTSGVVSSFASLLFRTYAGRMMPSLGASGAILGIIGLFCMQFPEGRLGILFLPMLTFPAITALKVVMGIDLAGCILGWTIFDHAAHLGGAAMGVFWYKYGNKYIWKKREPIIKGWDKIRS